MKRLPNLKKLLQNICGTYWRKTFPPPTIENPFSKLDDFKIFLPKYLSEEATANLFECLKDFPDNFDYRFYTASLDANTMYQGDGYKNVPMPISGKNDDKLIKAMLVSNTCDVADGNERLFTPFFMFSPIYSLDKYQQMLLAEFPENEAKVLAHIEAIKNHKTTQFFFLPSTGELADSFVRFDMAFSISQENINRADYLRERLFSLSDYGFYVLLFKLSVHFSRIREAVERGIQKLV